MVCELRLQGEQVTLPGGHLNDPLRKMFNFAGYMHVCYLCKPACCKYMWLRRHLMAGHPSKPKPQVLSNVCSHTLLARFFIAT